MTSFLSPCGTQGNGVCFRHMLTPGNTRCYYMCPAEPVQGSSLIFLPAGGIFPVVPFPVPAHFSTNQHHPCCAGFFGGLHTTVGSLLSAQTNTDRHKLSTIKVLICLICHHVCAMLMNMNERCKHFVKPVELKYKKRRKFRGLNCFL